MVDRAKLVGSLKPQLPSTICSLHIDINPLYISMYLVTRQKRRTACVCLTWILLILLSLKTVINSDKTDIARNLTLFPLPQMIDRQGELPLYLPTILRFQTVQLIIEEAPEK